MGTSLRWRECKVDVLAHETQIDFQLIAEISADIIFQMNLERIITYCSPSIEQVLGYKIEEVIGTNFVKFILQADFSKASAVLQQVLSGNTIKNCQFRLLHKDNSVRYVEFHAIPVIIHGQITSIQGICRDITEYRQTEVELLQSEEKFRVFSEQSLFAICLIQDNRIKYVNQAFLDFVNVPLEVVLTWTRKDYVQHIHPDDLVYAQEQGRKKQAGEKEGVIPHYSLRMITSSGEIRWVDIYSKTILYKGEPADFIKFTDITERKRMEEELRENEERFRILFEQSLIGICLIQDEKIKYTNRVFSEIIEFSLDEILSWTKEDYLQLLHPDDRSFFREQGQRIKTGELEGISPRQCFRLVLESGKEKWIEIYTKRILHMGSPADFITLIDITERKKAEEELIKTKKRLEYLLKECPAIIYSCTLDGHFETTFMSENVEKILGHHNDNFVHKPEFWERNIHPEDTKHVITAFSEIIKQRYYSGEYRFKHKDRSYRWMLEEANLILDDLGNPLEIVGFWTDITERKKMEQAIKESDADNRQIVENIGDIIFTLSTDGSITSLNPAFEQLTGWDLTEFIGKHFTNIIHPEDVPEAEKSLEIVTQGKSPHNSEVRLKTKSDQYLVFEGKLTPQIEQGKVIGYFGTARNITERKRTEEALKESEEKFRSIFENAPIGMALIDSNFKFNKSNPAFCNMMGYSNQELIQRTYLDITHLEDQERDITQLKKLTDHEISTFQTEKQFYKKSNDRNHDTKDQEFWTRTTVTDIGDPENYLVMIEDITAMKQMEEEMKRQSLKFSVKHGSIYLIKENIPSYSHTVIKDLLKVGYKGIIFSRTIKEEYGIEEDFEFYQLSEKNGINKIVQVVEYAAPKSVILIDRLEYLVLMNGFEKTGRLVYKLRETAYLNNLIVILCVDPSTLEEREIRILEKESQEITPRGLAYISVGLLEILRLIFQKTKSGIRPSYSDISSDLNLSRPTVRKRLKELLATGYIVEQRVGNRKILELTENGRILFKC